MTSGPDVCLALRRLLALAALLSVTVGALAACSPPPDSRVAAAYLGNGQVEILAYVCDGYEVGLVQVFEVDGGATANVWEAGPPPAVSENADEGHLLRFAALDAPDGWDVSDSSLTRFERGVRYSIAFSTIPGEDSEIIFTLEELEQLGNQVWTGETRNEYAASEQEFVDAASSDCG